jgi:hypothetical protein
MQSSCTVANSSIVVKPYTEALATVLTNWATRLWPTLRPSGRLLVYSNRSQGYNWHICMYFSHTARERVWNQRYSYPLTKCRRPSQCSNLRCPFCMSVLPEHTKHSLLYHFRLFIMGPRKLCNMYYFYYFVEQSTGLRIFSQKDWYKQIVWFTFSFLF